MHAFRWSSGELISARPTTTRSPSYTCIYRLLSVAICKWMDKLIRVCYSSNIVYVAH
jgi:hypothetical protein